MEGQQPHLYLGTGATLAERGLRLPPFVEPDTLNDPAGYLAEPGLRDAVNVSLMLGVPLLVTGEPGTGKTQLAASVAHELGIPGPLVFNTKSASVARDLFYRYDSLAHFHDAHFSAEKPRTERYVAYEALGQAILLGMDGADADPHLPAALRGRGPTRSVVLVDEIDKAPRDLPNDLLNEIETASFTVRETGRTFTAQPGFRPVVIITSNSERSLPDAFLRRCVFYYIPFPDSEQLRQIVERRLRPGSGFTANMLDSALRHFERLRELALKKKPATAELLAWIRVLESRQIDLEALKPGDAEVILLTYAALAKNRGDLEMMERSLLREI